MIKKITLTVFMTLGVLFASASAQTAIAPEKQAAIKELIAVMKSEFKTSDLIASASEQAAKTAVLTVKMMLDDDKNLTPTDKKMLEDLFLNDQNNMLRRFQTNLLKKLDFDALIEEMTMASYDKYFTLEEIKDVTAFYKSPTGQKMLKTTPAIFADLMQTMTEKVYPKMLEVITESEEEMKREVEVKIKEQKSKPKGKAIE